ncbi:MAG: T9SS type A sorting domain-containing protein, partial [Bacteroidetes bacterium]|nr:T9SS type A sorting domain-containing protein [Bacteroidota bacterium]
TPNEKGFNMERNTLTDATSTTFTSANWTKNSTETCSTLGYASFATAPLLVINTGATDWTTCPGTVQFTVTATATPAPISSYTWYYNDFNLMNGWQFVSGNITGATGTNTATLTLPADFAPLYNYQFYCDINKTNSGNSCTKATNAAYFTYPTAPYYRTKASTTNGSWTTANEWEMTTDINFVSPAPITACAYPLSVNSSAAFIQNGTKTTIGDGVSSYVIDIDKITIDGTLELHKKSSLFVYDSTAGADMIVNGTLIDRGSSSNGIAFTGASYLSGSGWTMGSAATVIKTNNASVDEYKTHYQDGISTIPDGSAGANWIYQYNGDGNPSVNAIGMFYPNLIFENTTGAAYSFITSTSLLKGGSDYCTVKGNFNIGTTGTNPVTVYNNNFNTQAMKVLGNLSIGTGSILSNASYDGNTSVNHGHGTGIELSGNLTNDGTFTNNSNSIGILRFKGTGTQIVSGAGTFNLYNVELDKPSQTLVDQQVNLTAQNNLNFNAGGILKTNSNVFSVNNGSITNAVTGHDAPYTGLASPTYSNDKYIFGRLERMVNTNGIYDFPVGDAVAGEGYNPIRFERISGTGNATAWFIPGDPGSINVGPVSVSCTRDNFYHFTDMTGEGKWRMSGASFNYNIYLHPNQNNNNVHPNELGTNYPYFYRNNYRTLKATDGTTDWTPFAGDGNICVVGSYYNCPGTNFSGFSDFAIPGGDGLSTALPIELVSFTAKCIENEKVQLHWITASERNSANFIIEKSLDAIHFYPIGTVQAAGNSISELHYQFIDELPNDKAYYRLKQIDLDNKENIHPVIYTKCGLTINGIQVYYAGNNQIHADIQTNKTEDYIFNLYQTDGKLIFHHSKVILEGKSKVILSHNQLAKGIYLLQVINGENMQTKKIVVD